MVARALLTWVIKAVRICMVDLKDREAADARVWGGLGWSTSLL